MLTPNCLTFRVVDFFILFIQPQSYLIWETQDQGGGSGLGLIHAALV